MTAVSEAVAAAESEAISEGSEGFREMAAAESKAVTVAAFKAVPVAASVIS